MSCGRTKVTIGRVVVNCFHIPIAQYRLDRSHHEGQSNEYQLESADCDVRVSSRSLMTIAHVPNTVGARHAVTCFRWTAWLRRRPRRRRERDGETGPES